MLSVIMDVKLFTKVNCVRAEGPSVRLACSSAPRTVPGLVGTQRLLMLRHRDFLDSSLSVFYYQMGGSHMMEGVKFHQPREPEKQVVLLTLSPKVSKLLKLLMQYLVLR